MSEQQIMIPKEIATYKSFKKRLNYNKLMTLLDFHPHEKQVEIINTIKDGNFEVMTITCGRRFGKTFVISFVATAELTCPYSSVLLMTPTFSNASVMYLAIEKNLKKLGIAIVAKDSKQLTFETELNSKIFVVTPKSVSNALGKQFSFVVFDEGQDIPNIISLWENYLEPAQADYGVDEKGYKISKTVFIATARDKNNEMYQLVQRASGKGSNKKYKGKYINFTYPTSMNPYIPKAFLENKKATLDPVTFGREYEGIWSDSNEELVYYAFNEKNIIELKDLKKKNFNPNNVYIAGIDVGYSDNTAYLLAVVEPFTGNIYVLEEYAESSKPLPVHYESFVAIENKYGNPVNIYRYGDPSASQTFSDLAYQYNYIINPANNSIDEGVKTINSLFYSNKLIISEKCEKLIEEIENMKWKANSKDVERSKKYGHFDLAFGALRYMVLTWTLSSTINITKL